MKVRTYRDGLNDALPLDPEARVIDTMCKAAHPLWDRYLAATKRVERDKMRDSYAALRKEVMRCQ